jgi:hypothetical protein
MVKGITVAHTRVHHKLVDDQEKTQLLKAPSRGVSDGATLAKFRHKRVSANGHKRIDMMRERQAVNTSALLIEAEHRLRSLSPERLQVANDFLAYLQEREEDQATAELLSIPGFQAAFRRATEQADNGDVVRFEDIRRDV